MPARRKAIDIHVGKRLRLQRGTRGLTQAGLAELVGVTYQQIQKYESGSNRIAAGRLKGLAEALGVTVAYFFDEAPPGLLAPAIAGPAGGISEGDLTELTEAFLSIRSTALRKGVIQLIELIAAQPAAHKS